MDGKRPTVAALHGLVAAAHPLAAQAGAKLLATGGNAFDAAVATAAALGVVEPFMSGLAGVGMAVCYVAAEQRVRALDFVTNVPAKFPAGRLGLREELARGPLACSAPGSLAGWCELVNAHGRKKLPDIFAPAIALARDGHALIELSAAWTVEAVQALQDRPFFAEWRRAYLGEGTGAPGCGTVMRQPDLARTLETIAAEGPEHFYRGALGRKLAAHVQALGGCLTAQDLAAVSPVWRDPLAAAYRGVQMHTLPPPCEGFQFLLSLRILDGFDLKAMPRDGVEQLDTVWRAIRLAAGLRIAQNRPSPEVLQRILSEELVEALRSRVRDPRPVSAPTDQFVARQPDPAREHTTSFSVVDREGNAVCVTQSLGGHAGSGVVVPGTGISLNNALSWGDVDARRANALLPDAALALPMAPAIATVDGKPVLLLGTPGGYGISQSLVQTLVQHLDYGLAIQEAIEAPRARLWNGRRVQAEGRIPAATIEALCGRGHDVEMLPAWSILAGGVQAIAIDPQTRVAAGGADPRREGYVAVP